MDFANERYIRLYTRDTATWALLRWEARAVLPQIFRKVDRAGVLEFPRHHDVVDVVARLIDFPREIVAAAVRGDDGLLEAGVIRLSPGALVVPNFVDAQEAPASPAERQRRRRERAATMQQVGGPPHERVTRAQGFGDTRHPELIRSDPDKPTTSSSGARAPARSNGRAGTPAPHDDDNDPLAEARATWERLDRDRRELCSRHQREVGGLSRAAGVTLEGIAVAITACHGVADVVAAVHRHAVELVIAGKLDEGAYRFMFKGDGFPARYQAWQTDRAAESAAAAHRAEREQRDREDAAITAAGRSLDPVAILAATTDSEFVQDFMTRARPRESDAT